MKRLVAVAAVSVIGASVAGWYLLKGQPAATPAKQSTTQQPVMKLDPSEHGFFDVDFSQKMIAHHQQGVKIADLALATSTNQSLKDLASELRVEQSAAAEQYIIWLEDWGERYTNLSDFPQMDGHDMYPSYPGLVSMAELTSLESASGAEVDIMFATLMTKHHKGGMDLEEMSNKLQFGKLIEYKDKVFGGYPETLERLKEI